MLFKTFSFTTEIREKGIELNNCTKRVATCGCLHNFQSHVNYSSYDRGYKLARNMTPLRCLLKILLKFYFNFKLVKYSGNQSSRRRHFGIISDNTLTF